MREFIKSWKYPVVLFAPGITYACLLMLFNRDMPLEVWWGKVVMWVCLPAFGLLARFETPRQTRERNERIKQREAEEFDAMTPEQQQLHIHAKNKVAEFNFSLVVFLITSIASGYLIYLCIK